MAAGLRGGRLLLCLAQSIRAGRSHLDHLDPLREDAAGGVLRAVAEAPAPETASQLAPRCMVRQYRAAVAGRARAAVALDRFQQ